MTSLLHRIAWVALPLSFSVGFAAGASAQQIAENTVPSGTEIRLDWIATVTRDCRTKAPPPIRPTAVTSHGVVRVVSATVTTKRIAACPAMKVPAMVVLYRSTAGYKGPDSFALLIGEGGEAVTKTYRVIVE